MSWVERGRNRSVSSVRWPREATREIAVCPVHQEFAARSFQYL